MKKKKKPQDENIMSTSAMLGGHKTFNQMNFGEDYRMSSFNTLTTRDICRCPSFNMLHTRGTSPTS